MSERAAHLLQTADDQISELIELIATAEESALQQKCAGREKLGDGTIAAIAMHTADNYHRLAEYLAVEPRGANDHRGGAHTYRANDLDRRILVERLVTARTRLSSVTELSDERLDAVPPPSEMRFADGRRTLDQIVASVLTHQRHQCDALKVALG